MEGRFDIYLERLRAKDPSHNNSIDTLKIKGRTKEFDGKKLSYVNFAT